MVKYGVMARVGIIAVLIIIIGNTLGFLININEALIFTGMGILVILATIYLWKLHRIVRIVGLILSIVYLNIGITALLGDSLLTLILNTVR